MIVTTAQAKSLLQITGTSKDSLIAALIPEAEAKYLQVRNFPFMQIQGTIANGDKTVSNIKIYPQGQFLSIVESSRSTVNYLNRMEYLYGSTIDNYITDIDVNNNTLEIDTASTTTATDVIFTVYPQGAKLAAAKIIQYLMEKNSMSGLKSESVGSYSWSKSDISNPCGIPDEIFKSIKRYVNV